MGAADATVRQVSQLQQRETDYKSQLDALKAAASQANAAALAAAQQQASTSGRLGAEQAGDGGLRARLEGAVAAMQAGLVERDTEVGMRGCGSASAGMARQLGGRLEAAPCGAAHSSRPWPCPCATHQQARFPAGRSPARLRPAGPRFGSPSPPAALQPPAPATPSRPAQVRLLLLAALAGEHILYIGPPGTAKSELGRRLSRLCHGVYFERLLTRFSVSRQQAAASANSLSPAAAAEAACVRCLVAWACSWRPVLPLPCRGP